MKLEMDSDVQLVAEYMQSKVATDRLIAVARSLAILAPALWGRYGDQAIDPLKLFSDPISLSDHNMRPASSEYLLAG